MSDDQQAQFARFMRGRLPKPKGAKWHTLYAFTEYSAKVLRRRISHWRSLTVEEAQQVMKAAAAEYPG